MRHRRDGFTLLETVIALSLLSLVAYGGTMTVSTVVRGTQRSSDEMTALRQVQNVGYWISRDFMNAQTIAPGDDPGTPQVEFVSLFWTDWETAETYNIYYYSQDASGGLLRVMRHVRVLDSNMNVLSDTTQSVGENMVGAPTISQGLSVWRVVIQARSGQQTETREYDILPRPDA